MNNAVNKFTDSTKTTAVKYAIALAAVLGIGSLLVAIHGENPVVIFRLILKGAFGNKTGIGGTIRYAMPCIFIASSAAVAFRAGINNLGQEGQLYFGSLLAAVIGYSIEAPPILHVALCLFASGIAGLLWSVVPALLKLYFDVSELVSTLMFNFIAVLLTEYITMWWIFDGQSSLGSNAIATPVINNTAKLSTIIKGSSASSGIFIALIVVVIIFVLFRFTIPGYEIKQVGENLPFAKVGGVNVVRTYLCVFLFSGLIAGLCGGVEVTGSYNRFTARYAVNMGWDGIMVTHIANRSPLAIVVVSIIWGALKAGALHMERVTSLDKLTVNILQMLFVLFVSIDYKELAEKWHYHGKLNRELEEC